MTSLILKINVIKECFKLFRNWHLYPLVYFGLIKSVMVCFHTKDDRRITLRTDSTDLMALTNVWLTKEYSKDGFEIKESDTIIDIGSHIGLFALLASKQCRNGKIFCFEPIQENYELLLKNIQDNNVANIYPHNIAVSNTEQRIKIYLNSDQAGHSIFLESKSFIDVNSTTLKKIIDDNKIDMCNLLKIDCEGAEYEIIESLPDQYLRRIEKMIIEYHFADLKPEALGKLVNKLKTNSFDISLIEHSSGMGLIYAKNLQIKKNP